MPAREPITDNSWLRRHAEMTHREKKTWQKPLSEKRIIQKIGHPDDYDYRLPNLSKW